MPERQCNGCTNQAAWGCKAVCLPSTADDPKATPDGKGGYVLWLNPAYMPLTLDNEETYACPRQDLHEHGYAWHRMLLFYGMYRKGHLPQPGAVMDQSNKAVELFRILDDVNHDCDRVEQTEQKKRQQPSRG